MNQNSNCRLTGVSQKLRNDMTEEERKLWYCCLKKMPYTFNRQKVIGDYVVDFYCAKAKLVIELDGSQHYEDGGMQKDKERDAYLARRGISVVRYSNLDIVRRFDEVCQDLYNIIERAVGMSE